MMLLIGSLTLALCLDDFLQSQTALPLQSETLEVHTRHHLYQPTLGQDQFTQEEKEEEKLVPLAVDRICLYKAELLSTRDKQIMMAHGQEIGVRMVHQHEVEVHLVPIH